MRPSQGIFYNNGSGWQEMNLPSTGVFNHDLRDIKMLSATYGWAVGSSGVSWHWDGSTWEERKIDHYYDWLNIYAVDIVTEDNVWMVGSGEPFGGTTGGVIIHWHNNRWSTTPVSPTLNDVSMTFATNGWIVGDEGSIFHWDNSSWISETSPVTSDLHSISILPSSPSKAWVVGDDGAILHTSGTNWTQIASPVTESLKSIAMLSPTEGWIVGDGGAILQYDGANWAVVASPIDTDFSSVTAVSSTSAYAVSLEGGVIYWNGSNWQTLFDVPDHRGYLDMMMLTENDGWAAGEGGRLTHWNGSNWVDDESHTSETLYGLDFLATDEGWAVGENGTILKYDGSDWASETSPNNIGLNGIDMLSSTEGWAVGDEGAILKFEGTQWITFTSPTTITLRDVRMVDANKGWAVGGGFSGNWDVGYLDVILYWNGTTWDFGASLDGLGGFFSSLSIISHDEVYATNIFGLYHWDGVSWEEFDDPLVGQARGVDMSSNQEGWVTAWNGAISHWDGQRWEMVFNRTHDITAVDAISPHEAWAVTGDSEAAGGAILHYTTPTPKSGILIPGTSLVQSYPGHSTKITLDPDSISSSKTFTISYKSRPNDHGDLKGIDHFFELSSDEPELSTPLTVTIYFSDTTGYGIFPGSTNLYRLENNEWSQGGITIINRWDNGVEAVITKLGSFGILGLEEHKIFLPAIFS